MHVVELAGTHPIDPRFGKDGEAMNGFEWLVVSAVAAAVAIIGWMVARQIRHTTGDDAGEESERLRMSKRPSESGFSLTSWIAVSGGLGMGSHGGPGSGGDAGGGGGGGDGGGSC